MSDPVMMIGNAPVHRVEELRIPNNISYFTTDEALIAAHRHWLYPHFLDSEGGFDLVFQSWIMEVDGRVVLVDPCTGNGKPHPVPFFDMLDVPYIERMTATGLADVVTGDQRLSSGLAVNATGGHTMGHQMLHVVSGGVQAYFTGDCFHHPIQLVEPTLPFGDAEDPAAATAMRRRLVSLAVEQEALLIAAHLQAPYAIWAYRENGGVTLAGAGAL